MKTVAKGEYWWIQEGRKYWNVWQGNPFCIGRFLVSKTHPLGGIVKACKQASRVEKRRFAKIFPDITWGTK